MEQPSFSRKNTERFEPLDFKDAFSSAMAIMEAQLNQTNVNIETSITTQSIIIMGDQQRLEQVIINLLRNALDAVISIENPEIKVSLKKDKAAIFSEITYSRVLDFKKVYQAVNRPSNTDSIFNNYSMPQNVYDLED